MSAPDIYSPVAGADVAVAINCFNDIGAFDQLLVESAPLAWKLAPGLCHRDGHGDSCAWYHGVWQYLRLFGPMQRMWETDTRFMLDALGSLAADGDFRRVLVSGTADYALLARVIAAWRREGMEPDATVVDVCPTPLHFNRWFADRVGAAIETAAVDVLSFAPERPFDVITTHCFMNRFTLPERRRLVAGWRDMLRPGGAVVTVQKLLPDAKEEGRLAKRPDQMAGHIERIVRAAEARQALHGLPRAAVEEMARGYGEHAPNFAIRSADEVGSLFEEAGFDVRHLEQFALRAARPTESGVEAGHRMARVSVIAVRR
jgi:hypothetical protein